MKLSQQPSDQRRWQRRAKQLQSSKDSHENDKNDREEKCWKLTWEWSRWLGEQRRWRKSQHGSQWDCTQRGQRHRSPNYLKIRNEFMMLTIIIMVAAMMMIMMSGTTRKWIIVIKAFQPNLVKIQQGTTLVQIVPSSRFKFIFSFGNRNSGNTKDGKKAWQRKLTKTIPFKIFFRVPTHGENLSHPECCEIFTIFCYLLSVGVSCSNSCFLFNISL